MARKLVRRRKSRKPKKRRRRKRSKFSGQEILTLLCFAAVGLALVGLLVFPNVRHVFQTSREVPWTIVATLGKGQVQSPRDLVRDARGFLYTLDHGKGLVLKLDTRQGTVIETWPSTGPALLKEPFGLSLRPRGGVAVADFGHSRIVLFDSKGKLEKTFPGNYFGPRDVAVARNGTMALSDTGNHKIVFINQQGVKIQEHGSRGSSKMQLDEPRSLEYDGRGGLYVLDMRNRRYIRFDAERRPVSWIHVDCIQVDGDLPYLAVSPRGRVAVSSRILQAIDVFSKDGKALFRLNLKDKIHPIGLAFNGEDSLYVADELGRRIVLIRIDK